MRIPYTSKQRICKFIVTAIILLGSSGFYNHVSARNTAPPASAAACDVIYNRVYATDASTYTISRLVLPLLPDVILGSITSPGNAAGSDLSTYSTLNETISLLSGVLTGQTSQTLKWDHTIPGGTPVTLKLGRGFGVAAVAGGLRVQAFLNGTAVGSIHNVDQNLVSAVNGINEFEFTLTPGGTYDAVQVSLNAGLVSALQSVAIFGAYYHQSSSTLDDCASGTVADILTGFESPISGLVVATGLTAVTGDPWDAVDGDVNSFVSLRNTVGVNAYAKFDVRYKQPTLVGDTVSIKLGIPTGLLDLSVIGNITIQRYLGDVMVGSNLISSSLVSLTLLSGNSIGQLTFINDGAFDRIKILSGGIADALTSLDIYEIQTFPKVNIPDLVYDDIKDIYFLALCAGGSIPLPIDDCNDFILYDAPTGGNVVTAAVIQTWIPGSTHPVYVQAFRYGCETAGNRQEIEIRVTEVAKPVISPSGSILVQNGDQVTLNISNVASYGTGVTFEWYRDGALIAGATGSSYVINPINTANHLGSYTAVAVQDCKSVPSDPVDLIQLNLVGWKSYVVSTGEDFVSGNEEITYTIHIRNNSSVDVSDLIVTDNIPQHTTYIAGTASNGGTLNASTLTWSNIDVAAGGTATVSFKVKVAANLVAAQNISNVALIKHTPADPGTPTFPPLDNDTPTDPDDSGDPGTDIPVVLISNISVDKVADQARVVAGSSTSFTITLSNTGPSYLPSGANITLKERPGAGVTITSFEIVSGAAVITATGLDAVVTTNNPIAVGGEIVVRVHADVASSATGNITNGISVWRPDIPVTDPPVDDDTDPIPVDHVTDLAIVKTVDNNHPFVGEHVEFTLIVTNNGPSDATGVVVTDQLQDGYTYETHAAAEGSYSSSTHLWNIGDLAAGETATLLLVATVNASGDYTNTASVTGDETDPDLTNNEDSPDDPILPINNSDSRLEIVEDGALANGVDENVLEATILDSRADGVANAPITFTITRPGNNVSTQVVNTDANGVAQLVLTSTEVGSVIVAATTPDVTITGSPRIVTFVRGPVDHMESNLVIVKDDALANGIDKNILEATIVDAAGHPLQGENVLFTITEVDLSVRPVTITTGADGKAILELTSTKSGSVVVQAAVGAEISGSPKTVQFVVGPVDYNRSNLVVTQNNAVANGVDENILVATIMDATSNLIQGAAVKFDYTDREGVAQTTTLITGTDGKATLSLTSTKIGNVVVSAEVAGLAINGSPKTVTFVAGPVDYDKSTLVVTKNNANADGVDQNRLLATIVDAHGNPIRNMDVDFEITDVDLSTRTQTVQTDNQGQAPIGLRSAVPGDVAVAATVATLPINGSPQTVTFVLASNLSVYKTADDARVIAGMSTSFTITIRNNSTVTVPSGEHIILRERPGAGVEVTGFSIISGPATMAFNGNDATVTTSGPLPTGGEIVIKVTAMVAEAATGTITNGISVWAPDTPPTDDPDDEDDIPPVPVDAITDLAIVKTVNNYAPFVGSQIIFTLEATNHGPSDASGAWVLDQLPSGFAYVSSNATAGTYNVSNHRWTIGDMAAGQVETLTITVRVLASGDYINYGTITGDDEDPNLNNNTDTPDEPIVPQPVRGLKATKVASANSVEAGGNIDFTITFTNQGPNTLPVGSEILVQEIPSAGLTITGYQMVSDNATINNDNNEVTLTTNKALGVDESVVLRVSATVAQDAPNSISNRVKVWSPEKDPDDDPDDDVTTPDIPVDNSAKLGITKTADQTTVISGGVTTFTLTITNNGPGILKSGSPVTLEERPGAGVDITGYQMISDNATVAGSGNNASLTTTADVPKGGTITVKVTATVTAAGGNTITNGIAVWGPDTPPEDDPDDEDDTPPIPVGDPYALSIVKVSDKNRVVAGEEATFTVTITNAGPESVPAGDQFALRELPGSGLTITGYEITAGAATVQGNANNATVTTTAAIPNGGQIQVRITAMVDARASGTITNGIAVWSDSKDPDTDDPDDEDGTDPVPVDSELNIPNLFTPNGDGVNDRFVIKGLLQYDVRELTIINRWGNQVYHSKNYNNDWDGSNLPEGTYFYILEVRNSGETSTYRGPVAIVRNTTNR